MNITHLNHFIVIVQEGVNMSKAAKRLHISQPPLSQQMRALESILGVALFERNGKVLKLSTHGEIFYQRALQIVNYYEETKLEMTELGQGRKGQLTIAISIFYGSIFPSSIVFEKLKAFSKDYPNVKLKIIHTDGKQLLERMEARELDLVIINLPIQEELFSYIPLEKQNFSFIMSANIESNYNTYKLSFKEIKNYPLILLKRDTGQGLYEKIVDHCVSIGFQPNIVGESNNLSTIISLVDAGIGMTILPSNTPAQHPQYNLRVMDFSDMHIYSESVIMWLKGRPLSETARIFLSYLQ